MTRWLIYLGILRVTPQHIDLWRQQRDTSALLMALRRTMLKERIIIIRILAQMNCSEEPFFKSLLTFVKQDFLSVAKEALLVLQYRWQGPIYAKQIQEATLIYEERCRREQNLHKFYRRYSKLHLKTSLKQSKEEMYILDQVRQQLKRPVTFGI